MDIEQRIIYEKLKEYELNDTQNIEEVDKKIDRLRNLTRAAKNNVGFNWYQPVVSNKRFIGKIIVTCKKAIRRSIAWIMGPILEEQAKKNLLLSQIADEMVDVLKEIEMCRKEEKQEIDKTIKLLQRKLEKKEVKEIGNQK